MSTYTATLTWSAATSRSPTASTRARTRSPSTAASSSPASSSPHVVRVPMSREDAVDPEEMLVASLSSCHMLFFLDFARRAGFVIDAYVDKAEGVMGKDERGRMAMTQVTLNPHIVWAGEKQPTPEELRELHHKAHEACFIANSFRGDVAIAGGEAH